MVFGVVVLLLVEGSLYADRSVAEAQAAELHENPATWRSLS
jgi:hypothetical protein